MSPLEANGDLVHECCDACVLPLTGVAIAVFIATTTGAAWLGLATSSIVLGSLSACALYGFALTRAHAANARSVGNFAARSSLLSSIDRAEQCG